MREITVSVLVQYRSDGAVRAGDVASRVAEAILAAEPGELLRLAGGATYAGYSVFLDEKKKLKPNGP